MNIDEFELCLEFTRDEMGNGAPLFRLFRNGQPLMRGDLSGNRLVLAEALLALVINEDRIAGVLAEFRKSTLNAG